MFTSDIQWFLPSKNKIKNSYLGGGSNQPNRYQSTAKNIPESHAKMCFHDFYEKYLK